jgi:hypothetical protein
LQRFRRAGDEEVVREDRAIRGFAEVDVRIFASGLRRLGRAGTSRPSARRSFTSLKSVPTTSGPRPPVCARIASYNTCGSTPASDVTVSPVGEMTVPLTSMRCSRGGASRSPSLSFTVAINSTPTIASA